MGKSGIIFDVDGTLWDSSCEVARSWDQIFKKHEDVKRGCSRDDIMSVMGKPMNVIAEIFFKDIPKERREAYLKECEDNELGYLREHQPKAFDGVKNMFERLSQKYPLFIVSNCQSGYIELFMEICGLEEYVTDIECFGNNKKAKGDNIRLIAKRNGLDKYYYVGDIYTDYTATVEAGGIFVYAAYGFGEVNEDVLRADSVEELTKMFESGDM